MASSDCKVHITGSTGREALFDIHSSTPGDFVQPVLFDDETWSQNATAKMTWVYFKGDPMSGPTEGHPIDMPFELTTRFSIDLLDSANSTVQNVMRESPTEMPGVMYEKLTRACFSSSAPTDSEVFWDASAPFGHPDGIHFISVAHLANRSCPTNTFGLMTYRWTVPVELPPTSKYRLRLSTNDSDLVHYSGEVAVRGNHKLHDHDHHHHRSSHLGCRISIFGGGFILALGILIVLGWVIGNKLPRRRRAQYEPLAQDEKSPLPDEEDLLL